MGIKDRVYHSSLDVVAFILVQSATLVFLTIYRILGWSSIGSFVEEKTNIRLVIFNEPKRLIACSFLCVLMVGGPIMYASGL